MKIKDSKREYDKNGFLIIKDNPIAKSGVFDYYLSEIVSDIPPNDNKIVKVYRSFEDLQANKDLFQNKPIIFNHSWVGEDTQKAEGSIGSVITAKEPYLCADLIIYNKDLIKLIEMGEVLELSPGYNSETIYKQGVHNGVKYDFEQRLKNVNHLAVVKNGRSGSDLRIQDEKLKGKKMKNKFSIKKLIKQLQRVYDEDSTKEEDKTTDDDIDKRQLIKDAIDLMNKPLEDFEGGIDEKNDTMMKMLEKLAYDESLAKDKVSDEDATDEDKKVSDDDATDKKVTDEDEDEDKKVSDDENDGLELAKLITNLINSKFEEMKSEMKRTQDAKSVAYSEVSKIVGNFSSENMSANEIYKYGYKCLSNRTLDSAIDPKSAFLIQSQNLNKQVSANKSEYKLNEKYSNLLSNLK